MSNSSKKGVVYIQGNKGLHLAEFSTIDGRICADTIRARWSFIIINKKETEDLCADEKDKNKILETVVNKYSSYLKDAIKKESFPNNQTLRYPYLIGSKEVVIKNKLVKLQSAPLYSSKSYGSILKDKEYDYAYANELPKDKKINDKNKTTSSLDYTRQSAQKVLDTEEYKTGKSYSNKEQNSSYIIISMPYVYNIKKGSQIEELEAILYEDRISASYMPEVIVEYGVFYDGTNNNMYNVDFYRNFKKFLEEPCRFIINSRDEELLPKNADKDYETIQEYIAAEPNPRKSQVIMTMLQKQILNHNIRYFDKKSKESDEYDDSIFWQTKISNHAEKVFNYLIDVKNDDEDKLASNSEQNKFLYNKILPNDHGGGSFTNGETNISRLYKLYNGDDLKTKTDVPAVTRFKVYASGSGTNDVFEKEDYESDSIIGLGLGIGDTGVKAHIIYTCQKIAEQLRKASIFNVDELILDTFGFSRGATSARHFVCSIVDNYEITQEKDKRKYTLDTKDKKDIFSVFFEKEDGLYTRVGNKVYFNPLRVDIKEVTIKSGKKEKIVKNPYYKKEKIYIETISFRFVGIYDTVTHYGVKQSNDSEDLNIDFAKNENDKKFGHVTHIMAKDEFRYNFDAYSIFEEYPNKNTKVNLEEHIIPGAHADVGGGYNISSELTYLGQIVGDSKTVENKIIVWNKKFNWLEESNPILISNRSYLTKEYFDKKDNDKKDGFYYTYQDMSKLNIPSFYRIYMYKKNVSNKYEYVSLRFMYDKAIKKDDNLEKVPLASPNKKENYPFSDDSILVKVYKKLIGLQNPEDDMNTYKVFKDNYIHHSSRVGDFVNKPSMENKRIFYGQRIVYGSTGTNFTKRSKG